MLTNIRSHLAWKVFISYVFVVLVGVLVLATAVSLSAPTVFSRHLAEMNAMMSGDTMMGGGQPLQTALLVTYNQSLDEALLLAAVAAMVAAIAASYFISRQVVEPVKRMKLLSHRIAEGEYEERLSVSGSLKTNQPDELDQLALSFNQMADKLQKTEMMRRQLIGDVTHELRTPLAAIKGFMEGLIDGVMPATPETYQQIYAEADRLQRLVNDLQELSRVEAGAYDLKPEVVMVDDLIQTVVNHLKRQFDEKGIAIETKIKIDLPKVLVDKDRILQVLTNLVGNALQYTSSGGSVYISAERLKAEVVISVADTGIGIAPDHLPLIFNRFYRTDKSRARVSGGSGIGLTIAQSLVKAHHGRIWVESAEGKGSTFYFSLPVADNS